MYPSDLFRSLVVRSRNDSGGISFNKGYFGVVIPFDKKSVKQFGRKVILVIESNIDYDKLQEAIDNLLKSKEVSQKELAILANSNIRLMTIGNKEIKDINPDNPFTSILTYLSSTVTPDDFGGPISFSASNIKDNSVFVNYFNVQ